MSDLTTSAPEHSETWLRQRFARPRPAAPVAGGDGHLWRPTAEIRPAAVLVPLVLHVDGPRVLLTRRTAHLHDHAGQISFPGGRAEPDDPSIEATALREADEEIGLAPERVELLGTLHDYVTVTGYRVTPVVGLVLPPFAPRVDEFEVAEVFEVPLSVLLDERNHQRNSVSWQGRQRHYYAVPYGRYYIWGATAGMLMNLHQQLTELR